MTSSTKKVSIRFRPIQIRSKTFQQNRSNRVLVIACTKLVRKKGEEKQRKNPKKNNKVFRWKLLENFVYVTYYICYSQLICILYCWQPLLNLQCIIKHLDEIFWKEDYSITSLRYTIKSDVSFWRVRLAQFTAHDNEFSKRFGFIVMFNICLGEFTIIIRGLFDM